MSDSFTRKKLTAVITLGNGQFGADGGNVVTLENMRMTVNIEKAGGIAMGTATIRIFGMRVADMNQVTMLAFHPLEIANNTIQVSAGDDENMSVIYQGTIRSAWADYQSAPDVPLLIEAMTGYFPLIKPADPISFQAATDVAGAMSELAKKMGYAFENNGVQVSIASPYLAGTDLEKARALAKAADIDLYVDDNTLAICPKGVARGTQAVPLISRDTGMIGYPSFDKMGISFDTIFNPAIVFGGLIEIASDVKVANGKWRVVSLGHFLQSETPNGLWVSRIWCTDNALAVFK